jgi:hypothetical protein
LDTFSTKRQQVLMDGRKKVLFSSIDFPSTTLTTNCIVEELTVGYFKLKIWLVFSNFEISVVCFESYILVLEHEFLVGTPFFVLAPMVKILVLIRSSLFSIQANVSSILVPTTKSWFLVPSCDFWILVPSTKMKNLCLYLVHFPGL